nr:hypothetical protein [uncultured Lacibacter sp.]
MRYSNYIGIAAGLLMILVGTFTWSHIPSINANVTGFGSETFSKFGKPVLMNVILFSVAAVLFLIPKLWAKKANPFVGAINFAWALRNLVLLSTCQGGECPQTTAWLYVYFGLAFIMLVMTVLPDMKVIDKK